jgi:2C-methyl-D-erythritol 2,4-cyclodiphosphate synthase
MAFGFSVASKLLSENATTAVAAAIAAAIAAATAAAATKEAIISHFFPRERREWKNKAAEDCLKNYLLARISGDGWSAIR